jgi:alpha-D-xyloside xylohydrolase
VPAHLFNEWPTGPGQKNLYHYDPTNPEARKYIWQKVRAGYYRHGIKVWWLDACEPEIRPLDPDNLRYHIGNGAQVGCIHPLMHQQGFYEGMRSEGEDEIITLCRSAWLGSQRYGAAVWSGDIPSTFESLRQQVTAGLNIAMSGICWWTTDIGGFQGGDINSPYFRELIVRWFQYGVFCPLFRLHGVREPGQADSGAPNEVWSFGEKAYKIIRKVLLLREKLRPYIMKQMRVAHRTGLPMMRPLFFDFVEDKNCYDIEDQFLFGPDILVAPVLHKGAKSRDVYLPKGANWTEAGSKKNFKGGRWIKADAPLEKIPFYIRAGSGLSIDD